jgi:hypothetical protein
MLIYFKISFAQIIDNGNILDKNKHTYNSSLGTGFWIYYEFMCLIMIEFQDF